MTTPAPQSPEPASLQGICPLPHWGVIRVQGEDAAKFLHGQLTNDFALLGQDHARLAGFCSAKGRLQASFIGFKAAADEVWLVCSRDLLSPTLKRLSMFVLRAQAKLTDASDSVALFGVAGSAVPDSLRAAPWWTKQVLHDQQWVRLPDAAGQPRALCCALTPATAPAGAALPAELWQWLEVRSGVATVTTPLIDAFVPQMLNYESVGGVNFKKGCYPGQEVVARSQFRGTLKRRAYLAHSPAPAQVGQEVFHSSDAEQPCGTVAAAAAHPHGGFDLLVSMQTSATESGQLNLGSPTGAALQVLPLPYELLADV